VHLKATKKAFLDAFEGSSVFVWDDGMEAILGTDQPVVEIKGPGAFGLKGATAESGQPVWWYPFSVIERIVTKEVDSPDCTESLAEPVEVPRRQSSLPRRQVE